MSYGLKYRTDLNYKTEGVLLGLFYAVPLLEFRGITSLIKKTKQTLLIRGYIDKLHNLPLQPQANIFQELDGF
jgi:hypothetical protein